VSGDDEADRGLRRKRERLLAQVRARLDRFFSDRNPAAVLDPEVVAEVTALLETLPDPAADLEVARRPAARTGRATSSWTPAVRWFAGGIL
jgi:hypothetical protein